MTTSASHLQKKIFRYMVIGLSALTISLSFFIILPIYGHLIEFQDNTIYHAAQTRVIAINEWVKRAKDIAWQITSRSELRQKLEQFKQGDLSLIQLRSITESSLVDAMQLSEEVVGILRVGQSGQIVAKCGLIVPKSAWPPFSPEQKDVVISKPVTFRGNPVMILGAPILNGKGEYLGTDLVTMEISRLKRVVSNYTGLGKTSEIVVCYLDSNQVRSLFPYRLLYKEPEKSKTLDKILQGFLQNAINEKEELRHADEFVMAYAPVPGCNLGLLVSQNERELYGPLHNKFIILGLLFLFIYSVFLLGLWFIMKPFTDQLLLHTDELEEKVEKKTTHLKKEISDRIQAEETLRYRFKFERIIAKIYSELAGAGGADVDPTIARALESIGAFIGADRAFVYWKSSDALKFEKTHEWYSRGVDSQKMALRTPILVEDLPWFFKHLKERKVYNLVDVGALPPEAQRERDWMASLGIQSAVAVPVEISKKLKGFIGFDTAQMFRTWRDDDINLLRFLGETIGHCIERNHVEKEQENLQLKLANTIEMAQLGPWEFDVKCRMFTFNDHFYKMFRTSADQVGGYTMSWDEYVHRFVHPEAIQLLKDELKRADTITDVRIPQQLEHQIRYADGSIGYVSIRYFIIKDADNGKTVNIYGVNQDITDRKRAEEKLRESEEKLARSRKMESLGLLAGGVAHDLNNILSGITSYPELLLLNMPEDDGFRKPLELIQDSGNKAAAIVQDLLTTARGVASAKEPLSLNQMVEEYLISPEFAKLRQFNPAVEIATNLEGKLLNIKGSPVHVRKAIMNLVSNAAEAIEGCGAVTISTSNRYIDRPMSRYENVTVGEYAVLSVSDSGAGITSEDLERLFEPFYTKKVMGRSGTGLGLTVVWNVVQDHHGYVDVSANENGTMFELYFPVTREEIWEKDAPKSIQDYLGNGETILVVDDVESQNAIFCKMLEMLGYQPKSVSCGEAAVDYIKENKVALILLDMIMASGMDGRETYERIVKIQPGQKAIIVSGFAETAEVKKTQRLGAGQFVKKPVQLEKLGMAIKEELGK